jgi:hypothetical protein
MSVAIGASLSGAIEKMNKFIVLELMTQEGVHRAARPGHAGNPGLEVDGAE